MHDAVDIPTAARLIGVSHRRVRQMCSDGQLPGAVRRGRSWSIPRTADPRLARVKGPEQLAAELPPDAVNAQKMERAVWKRGLIEQAESFCSAAVRSGSARSQALAAFCRQADVPVRNIQRWRRQWRSGGLAGLIDARGGQAAPIISDDAWREFISLYLDPRRPSVRQCLEMVAFINQQQQRGWTLPGLRRMQQLAAEKIPLPVAVLHREGQSAYDARCAPYVETDMATIEPGAVWIGDHHQFDCWVRHRGKWIRPWITAWEDMRSRTLVGWQITPSPNSTTILQAFRRGCQSYGPPGAVKIDNGKDYDSELWTGTTKQRRRLNLKLDEANITGLYAMMDIAVSFAIKYHAQSKSVERWFDTLEGRFVRTMPTYCGKDTARRPEGLADYLSGARALDEAMELDAFGGWIAECIGVYNRTPHTGRGMDGQVPLEVLSQRRSRRMIDAATMGLLCQVWTGELTVGKNGVNVKGLWYGQYDTVLMAHQGRKVRCSYDEDDMSRVRVYEANSYNFIATAEQARMIAYGQTAGESDLREAMAAKARARKQIRQYRPAARIAATDLPNLVLQAAAARTRPVAGEGSKPVRPVVTPLDGQAAAVRRSERMRAVKRAAGAESLNRVTTLEWDFDDDNPERRTEPLEWDEPEPEQERPMIRLEYDE